jgi:hypothetical protein
MSYPDLVVATQAPASGVTFDLRGQIHIGHNDCEQSMKANRRSALSARIFRPERAARNL